MLVPGTDTYLVLLFLRQLLPMALAPHVVEKRWCNDKKDINQHEAMDGTTVVRHAFAVFALAFAWNCPRQWRWW